MPSRDDTLDLPFDQYQRYRLVADLVRDLERRGQAPARILDVGGRTALLRRFLPESSIVLVDPDPSDQPGLVLGSGSSLPFADDAFDLVCAFDTLEHVPPEGRDPFVRECARVAARWVVLAGPYAAAEVDQAEELVLALLTRGLGVRHRYLAEHRDHGLPRRERVEELLHQLGARVESIAHGQLETWLVGMCAALVMDAEPSLQASAGELHRFINRELYGSDWGGSCYRHVVVGAFGDAALPSLDLEPARETRTEGPRRIVELLAGMDLAGVSRREMAAERERFRAEESRWLEQRREHEEERRTLTADLRQQKEERVTLAADLAEHKKERATLAADLAEHKKSVAQLTKAIATERADRQRIVAELEARLDEHARVEAELRGELADNVAAREALEAQLASEQAAAAQVRAALERDLEGHRASLAEVSAELERHRQALEEHRQALEEHRQALRASEERVHRRDALLAELAAELRDRRRNLARAFARAKYTLPELD